MRINLTACTIISFTIKNTFSTHDGMSAEAYCTLGGKVVPMKTEHLIGEPRVHRLALVNCFCHTTC